MCARPLARIADQVFVDLAQELEGQGVGRRVAADRFGMALRSYQKKLRRLTESQSAAERTLWRSVLEHIRQQQGYASPISCCASAAMASARWARS